MLSPLRYPGGKARYIPLIEHYANNCKHDRYIEPFAGGAGVALHFAIKRHTQVVINDKDPRLYAFWRSIVDETDRFIEKIHKTPVDLKHWRHFKEILMRKGRQSLFELGFATFYHNRCNFSGCLNASPIGGIEQKGKWKIDARFNKSELIQRIEAIVTHKDRIHVTQLDALDLVRCKTRLYDFMYLDPPYYKAGKYLYQNYLKDDGHEQLAEALEDTPASWLMSYDRSAYIKKLYQSHIISTNTTVNYSFLKKSKQKELLIFSLPDAAAVV